MKYGTLRNGTARLFAGVMTTLAFVLCAACILPVRAGLIDPVRIRVDTRAAVDWGVITADLDEVRVCVARAYDLPMTAPIRRPLIIRIRDCELVTSDGICAFRRGPQTVAGYARVRVVTGEAFVTIGPDLRALRHELAHVMPHLLGLRWGTVGHDDAIFARCAGSMAVQDSYKDSK